MAWRALVVHWARIKWHLASTSGFLHQMIRGIRKLLLSSSIPQDGFRLFADLASCDTATGIKGP